jgi:fatty acid desaturase (delta-4 desaturase)
MLHPNSAVNGDVVALHAQVSHHIHCNDEAFDEDVFSAFPLLRFDARLPRQWYHKYQHIYMWIAFPFLQLAFQVGSAAAAAAAARTRRL